MKKQAAINNSPVCQVRMKAISDTMSLLSGKWKFHIIGTLIEGNSLRYMDLQRELKGIGSKMLSKELQDLEMNNLVKKTIKNTRPITAEYSITDHGKTLTPLINEIAAWGLQYREAIFKEDE